MISTATKTLQTNNKTIYVAILSTLTFFLFLDYIPGLQAWSAWVTPFRINLRTGTSQI